MERFVGGFIVSARRMKENSRIKVGDAFAHDLADALTGAPPMGWIVLEIIKWYDSDFGVAAKGLLEQKTRAASVRTEGSDIYGFEGNPLLDEPPFGGQSRVVSSIFPGYGRKNAADTILRNAALDEEIYHVIAGKAAGFIFVGGVANRAENQDFLKVAGAEDIGDLLGGIRWRPAFNNEQAGRQGLVGRQKGINAQPQHQQQRKKDGEEKEPAAPSQPPGHAPGGKAPGRACRIENPGGGI